MFEKLFTIWFVFMVCPAIMALTIYDIFWKDNPLSFLIFLLMFVLFFSGIHDLRHRGKRTNER